MCRNPVERRRQTQHSDYKDTRTCKQSSSACALLSAAWSCDVIMVEGINDEHHTSSRLSCIRSFDDLAVLQ